MNVMITGFAGFIGSNLTEYLIGRGLRVVGIDNFNNFYNPKTKVNNIKNISKSDKLIFYTCDLKNPKFSRYVSPKVDAVIHLAAYPGVRPSFNSPVKYCAENIEVTVNILEFCRTNKIPLVFASSSSVYGNNTTPFTEKQHPKPVSIYGSNKASCEDLCRIYHEAYGLDITILRFFTCYGPRQRPDLAIYKFSRLMLLNQTIELYGDGLHLRDYTYVDDTVRGIELSLDSVGGFQVYNIGSGRPCTTMYLTTILGEVLGIEPKINVIECQVGDAKNTHADITLAKNCLGWCPSIDIKDGLVLFKRWFVDCK